MSLYNCNKFKKFLHDKNLSKKDLAEQLAVNTARINELSNGKELLPILDRICHKFNIDISEFYGGYIEPDYMMDVRKKLNEILNKGFNYKEISKAADVNHIIIRDIINYPSIECSVNIANKIIFANYDIKRV